MPADPVVARASGAGSEPAEVATGTRGARDRYHGPRLVSFGSIPGRTFSIGANGVTDGGTGMFTMNTSP